MKLATRTANNWLPSLIDEMFNNDYQGGTAVRPFVPAVNIMETDAQFELELMIPGFSKDQVEIAVDNDVLSVTSKIEETTEEIKENYSRKEFTKRAFTRSFNLPETVNQDTIDATYVDGILHITLPKKDEAKPQPKRLINLK